MPQRESVITSWRHNLLTFTTTDWHNIKCRHRCCNFEVRYWRQNSGCGASFKQLNL